MNGELSATIMWSSLSAPGVQPAASEITTRLPLLITGATIWTYWSIVLLMTAYARLVRGQASALTPRTSWERMMWLVWVPVIAAWNTLPVLALRKDEPPWMMPSWAGDVAMFSARCAAAVIIFTSLLATIACWRTMGRSWSVAVVEDGSQQLVSRGLFKYVRHPIYTLSILMMLCTLIVIPTWPMMLVAALHIALMVMKAAGEERHLLHVHGDAYRDYQRATGRFVPRVGR